MTAIHHNHLAMAANTLTAATPIRTRLAPGTPTMPGGRSAVQSSGPMSALSAAAGAPAAGSTTAPQSGDITSNDFLTLLVSELKNQDPTQPTDPNAYITQMVGVNSLQQLISINQDLS